MAPVRSQSFRIKNQALVDVLSHILNQHELDEQARERIAGLIGQWGEGGDVNETT